MNDLSNQPSTKPVSRRRYHQLFVTILSIYLIATFFNLNQFGGFLIGLSLIIMILSAIRTFPVSHTIKLLFRLLTVGALGVNIADLLIANGLISQVLDLFSNLIFAFFFGLSILFLGRRMYQSEKVDGDTLLGGISLYLLFGILWYIFYRLVYAWDQNAFSQNLETPDYYLLYFSFTTLTTLGYGDIIPVNRIAMGLTNIEAIIGQLYPTIFLARLVSLYITPDQK